MLLHTVQQGSVTHFSVQLSNVCVFSVRDCKNDGPYSSSSMTGCNRKMMKEVLLLIFTPHVSDGMGVIVLTSCVCVCVHLSRYPG